MLRTLISSALCLIIIVIFCSCAQKGVIVTADPQKFGELEGCFDFLGASVEQGGPIVKRLCSQDINKIVSFSRLNNQKGERLKALVCGDKADPEKFKTFFQALTPAEKSRVIRSFELFGYNINGYGC